jgi:hypothetical protein
MNAEAGTLSYLLERRHAAAISYRKVWSTQNNSLCTTAINSIHRHCDEDSLGQSRIMREKLGDAKAGVLSCWITIKICHIRYPIFPSGLVRIVHLPLRQGRALAICLHAIGNWMIWSSSWVVQLTRPQTIWNWPIQQSHAIMSRMLSKSRIDQSSTRRCHCMHGLSVLGQWKFSSRYRVFSWNGWYFLRNGEQRIDEMRTPFVGEKLSVGFHLFWKRFVPRFTLVSFGFSRFSSP